MKTMFRVAVLFIWHFNCANSCRVKVKVPDFKPLQNAVAEQTRRGVSILEQQVTALRQDSNKHLETIRENTRQFFENALDRLTKAQESFTDELVPQLLKIGNTTVILVENLTKAVKKANTCLDISILLFFLLAFYSVRFIRTYTGNDIISYFGWLCLSLIEILLSVTTCFLAVNLFYQYFTGNEPKEEVSVKLAVGVLAFIAFALIVVSVISLFKFILRCILPSLRYLMKCLIWTSLIPVTVPFSWPLWHEVSMYFRLGLTILCVTVIGVILHYCTILSNGMILSYLFLFVIGLCANSLMYFKYPKRKTINENEHLRKQRLVHFTSNKTNVLKPGKLRRSSPKQQIVTQIKGNDLLRNWYSVFF